MNQEDQIQKNEIPIMFCFDNNYVIPAAVAFYSLLKHCNKKYYYKLYILHTDISKKNQDKLKETVKEFSDFSELIFIDMDNKFEELWETIKEKGHFSKEVMYKILVASIFPIYDKIIVSDVDVVFLNDVSDSYFMLDCNEDYYLAGIKMIGKMKWYLDQYIGTYTEEEIEKLSGFCGGYIIFNLKKIREDNMEEKFIECFEKEGYRINQMEQDVLNLCCYPKTKKLPLKYLACSYMWDEYKNEQDKETDVWYSKEEIDDAMNNTVQLHYATSKKPWKNVDCTKSEIWFEYLFKTPFFREYLENLPKKIELPQSKIDEILKAEEKRLEQDFEIEYKRKHSIKYRINKKFSKYLFFKIFKYIVKNPFFIFKPSFYRKIKKKLKINAFSLIILDDVFPSEYSPFRMEEYINYFKDMEDVRALSTGQTLNYIGEERKITEVIDEFEKKYPELKEKIFKSDLENKKKILDMSNKIAIMCFLNNVINDSVNNLDFLEKNEIPFIFTLYPGGGFILNDETSDKKIKRICSSNYFRKVIVTQKNVYEYLIEKELCPKEKIELIFGIVTPSKILNSNIKNKKYYGKDKENLDICFVAHKYSEHGIDKGYDLFIETAKILSAKYNNIKFHVIGGFDESEINVEDIKDSITFYGIKNSEWLIEFYKNMDIIISPNRPFKLSKGSFDGFPTGSCTEAMLNGVALLCTDELNLNYKFRDNKDLVLIKPDVNDIVEKIDFLYNNQKQIEKIANSGRKRSKKIYSKKEQIKTREKIIKKVAREYYKK